MTDKDHLPHRVAAGDPRFGRLIDRARTVDFRFDGARLSGLEGDTLASALMANGRRVVARSFKLHRPRGILGIGSEEPNALVSVGEGPSRTPNLRATMVPITPGMVAESQNRFPRLDRDWGSLADRIRPLLPAGFYYKTFKAPARLWPRYERLIRAMAGLGRAPEGSDPDRYEHVQLAVDVLVAGGGLAGLAAAEAAAAQGLTVLLADENPRLGGIADGYDGAIEGRPVLEWVRGRVAALAALPNVHLLPDATVAGLYGHGHAWIVERLRPTSAPRGGLPAPAERLWKLRARATVIATGAHEKPLVFPENDRPGIMLATAARLHLRRYGVAPGDTVVVATSGDEGYRTAMDLRAAGVDVERIVDLRLFPNSSLADIGKATGLPVTLGSAPLEARTVWGGASIDGIRVQNRLTIEGPATTREILCDTVLMSGGWSPAAQLAGQLGARLVFDEGIGAFRPGAMPAGVFAAGGANGRFDAVSALSDGYAAGDRAAGHVRGEAAPPHPRPTVEITQDPPAEVIGMLPDNPRRSDEMRAFVDFQNDVTVADLALAVREGYASPEHAKRYTTAGMAPDQGKTGGANTALILSRIKGEAPEAAAHTTFRPPYAPVTFGVIAGPRRGDGYLARRRSPLEAAMAASSPPTEPVGLWRRPACYPRAAESQEDAVRRETLAARTGCGIMDASTLGKFLVDGPDAATFIDRVAATDIAGLGIGGTRYVLFLDEAGFVIDDGIVGRLAATRYLVTTTSGGAERMAAWLERWRQTEWPDLDVHVYDETERWAQVLLSGPAAEEAFTALPGGTTVLAQGRSMAEGMLGETPVRVMRSRFTGDPSLEVAVPAGFGPALWTALLMAEGRRPLTPFGLLTLERLRLEAGNIAVGHETDGAVTARDLGLAALVSTRKQDFIGRHGIGRAELVRPGRRELVGIVPEDMEAVPPPGTPLLDDAEAPVPRRMAGHVTSSGFSPVLARGVALALVEAGSTRIGSTVRFVDGGKTHTARIMRGDFRTGARAP